MTLMIRMCVCTAFPALVSVSVLPFAGRATAADSTATTQVAESQQVFSTPEEAVKALQEATAAHDRAALRRIFGSSLRELLSSDDTRNAHDCAAFAQDLAETSTLVKEGEGRVTLAVGRSNWPFPVPIVRRDGTWFFDTQAGREEILNRRIGENELNTIEVCRACVLAQREYFARDWDNDDVFEYARRFRSTPGKKDGLYWPVSGDEEPSPLGPLVAQAHAEGYGKKEGEKSEKRSPYHGYYFKILTKQGMNAPGGKYDYVINGHMVGGFAIVAWPAEYGSSGIMTFIVNQRGKVYQKDLGPNTAEIGKEMTEYNPDGEWTLVRE